ncbi:MAG TPA: YceI family protein [Bacteriovoracaceae bacterium]|nr:YceI family protein [Bacteriovoracaceae bacterium]
MTVKYVLDPSHSSAEFSIKHMMISKVKGTFDKLSGSFLYDPQNLGTSSVEASIEVSSVNTRDEQRDNHLKSADFFDVEKYPLMQFKSSSLKKEGDTLYIIGNLSIHGVSKEVTLKVDGPSDEHKDPWGNLKIGASATTKINRKEFGLTWNTALEAGGFLVGEEVDISLDVQFTKEG